MSRSELGPGNWELGCENRTGTLHGLGASTALIFILGGVPIILSAPRISTFTCLPVLSKGVIVYVEFLFMGGSDEGSGIEEHICGERCKKSEPDYEGILWY